MHNVVSFAVRAGFKNPGAAYNAAGTSLGLPAAANTKCSVLLALVPSVSSHITTSRPRFFSSTRFLPRAPSSTRCNSHQSTPRLAAPLQRRSYFWVTSETAKPTAAATTASAASPPIAAATTAVDVNPSATAAPVTPTPTPLDPTLSQEFTARLDTTLTPEVLATAADASASASAPALTAITQLGDLAKLGLCNWTPVGLIEATLELVHVSTGLPWWGTIVATTVLARILLFPVVVKTQTVGAKMQNLRPVLGPLQEKMTQAHKAGNHAEAKRLVTQLSATYKANGMNPLSGLWGLTQAPVFMSFFFGLRAMAELPVPGFETGGILWFKDLTVADPTYLLPIVATTTMLVVLEAGMAAQASSGSQARTMKNVFRFMTVIFIPLMASMPAGVFMYWVSSNFFTLLQFWILRQPTVRGWLNIPEVRKDLQAQQPASTGMAIVSPMPLSTSFKMIREAGKRSSAAAAAVVSGAAR
ncbi:60Kd inner membrane protein-domain-containing protein [Zopfochytrium polystomum]|nr:60Kd inner membrane protein-domain-containing protein [Zopfochytrium polystomum]